MSENNNEVIRMLNGDKYSCACEMAKTLSEHSGEIFVIKIGGSTLDGNEEILQKFVDEILCLKNFGIIPVVIHGGGKKINEILKSLNKKSDFLDGLRITDKETLDVTRMALIGLVNKDIVMAFNMKHGNAIGFSGIDFNFASASKISKGTTDKDGIKRMVDLGFVGEVDFIRAEPLFQLLDIDFIPVIAPICGSKEGNFYNVNADTFAGAVASSIFAHRLILLTDTNGVINSSGETIQSMTVDEAIKATKDGTVKDGMLQKVLSCVDVVHGGCESVHIVNGNEDNAIIKSILGGEAALNIQTEITQ